MENIFSIIMYASWPVMIFVSYRLALWTLKKLDTKLQDVSAGEDAQE
jgi:hypothetical protein